jgi:hypothetical protein
MSLSTIGVRYPMCCLGYCQAGGCSLNCVLEEWPGHPSPLKFVHYLHIHLYKYSVNKILRCNVNKINCVDNFEVGHHYASINGNVDYVFVCISHYIDCLIKELAIDNSLGNPIYIPTTLTKGEIQRFRRAFGRPGNMTMFERTLVSFRNPVEWW